MTRKVSDKAPVVLKLPRKMPDGTSTAKHPFLWCLKNRMPEGSNKSTLAKAMGCEPQSIYKWERMSEENRNFSLPLERAIEIAAFFGVHPVLFRNDVQWPTGSV